MKLILIFVDADHAADVAELLEHHAVTGYSEIPQVLGKGVTGRKLGTRAFPGSSTLYFAAVQPDVAEALMRSLRALRTGRGSVEGLKAYSLDTMELL